MTVLAEPQDLQYRRVVSQTLLQALHQELSGVVAWRDADWGCVTCNFVASRRDSALG